MGVTKAHRRFEHLGRTVKLIAALLAGEQHDRESAAQLLGVQPAAADRQLRAVMKLPGVVAERRDRRRVVRFDKATIEAPPSVATAIAACFGASLGPLFRGTPYESGMTEAREHILQLARRRRTYRDIDRKFVFLHRGGELSLPDSAGQLDDLIEAVLAERWVRFQYQHFDASTEIKRVQALSLAVYDHQLYVIGRDSAGTLHPYRFARITNADVESRSFAYPSRAEYDPHQSFAASFGIFLGGGQQPDLVRLRLAPRWATHVRTHRWHPSQQVAFEEERPIVSLHVRVDPDVLAWVLSFGADAEVLCPESLRDRVAGIAREMGSMYSSEG